MTILILLLSACASDDASKSDDTGANTHDTDSTPPGDDTGPANLAPSAPVVAISPEHPTDADDLTVTILTEAVDPEGTAVTYQYAWTVDGSARSDLGTAVVPAGETSDGQTWVVAVTASDGDLASDPGSASTRIGNSPPSAPVIHLEPAEPTARQAIDLVIDTESVDPDGDTLTTTIHWYENELYYSSRDGLTSIPGLYVDGGDVFRVEVSVSDGVNAPVTVGASVTLPNLPPEITGIDVSPLSAKDGDTITVSVAADDPDGGYVSFRYVWYRDDVEATDVGDTDEVPSSATTPGEHWSVTVFGSDGHDEVSASSGEDAIVIPWEGTATRHVFSATLVPDGAGGYTVSDGQWALDYLSYGADGNNSCQLVWTLDATESDRYCRTCEYTFESDFLYDASSNVDFGCTNATVDGAGYFFFNESYDQFTSYSAGPSLAARATSIAMRLTGSNYEYTYSSGSLKIYSTSTSAIEDTAGNVALYMYYYSTGQTR